jgi:hypothetical protein
MKREMGNTKTCTWILLFLAAAAIGCGSDLPPLPTQPAPIPAATACGALGATAGLSILNGAGCDASRSPVVRLNMRAADGTTVLGNCTGTIVAPRVVLTAAHCLDEGVGNVRVWLGSGAEIAAESFAFYPNYRFDPPSGYDVGVLRMPADLPRTPVPILTSRDAQVGEAAIIAGWGRDQNNVNFLLQAGSTTISRVTVNYLETIFAPPSASVCQGDSGGPILLNQGGTWAIAGITSATSANVCNEGTNFYQSIRHPSMRDFILSQVPDIGQR